MYSKLYQVKELIFIEKISSEIKLKLIFIKEIVSLLSGQWRKKIDWLILKKKIGIN